MDQIGPKIEQNRLEVVPKIPFLLRDMYAFREIILNDVSLGGNPAISATLYKRVFESKSFHLFPMVKIHDLQFTLHIF